MATPSGGSIAVSAITPLTCTATITMTTLGAAGAWNYFLSSSPTNSTAGTMTDLCGLLGQTTSQAPAISGLTPGTTQYLFIRAQKVSDSSYVFMTTTGVTLTTTAGVAPSGGTCGTPSSVTSISATVAVTLTTLGTDSIYNYFVSSSPTNSTGGTMTNLKALTAQTASQNASLTLLAPSTTSYLFVRAQDVKTGSYIFMTTTGVTLTTLGTGSAPSGASITVTSAASTTAVVSVSMTTLGTNANYVYYVSWCATNSTGGTMANVCLLAKQTASQTVYPSGLPAGTSPYLFIRAKNVLTGAYTVMSASGTAITLSASSLYYEAAALTAFDPGSSEALGYHVAVSGSYAVIGAFQKDPVGITDAGAVYVLELNGSTGEWEHKSVLYPNDSNSTDSFGYSVAVNGTYVVVGAYKSYPAGKINAGAAYVFERNSGTGAWEQKTKMIASDGMPGDYFGTSVAVNGTYAICGAYNRYQLGAQSSGGAYVFERNSASGVWEQKAFSFPSDLPMVSRFGCRVSVSGTYAIVGAYLKTGGGGAYVYERNSGTGVWEQKAILTCSDSTTASFGWSVCIDGTYAVVGARAKTVNSFANAGGAYVFERVSGTWTQTATLENPDPAASDFFGQSVSVSGIYVVIGSYQKDPASKIDAGSTYLYKRNSTTGEWENKVEWAAIDGLTGDNMGNSVDISGTHVFSGAHNKSVNGIASAGGAYVYELPSGTTVPPSSVTISVPNNSSSAAVTIGVLGTDATYTYVVSYSTTNSSSATMTDCGTCVAQTTAQNVTITGPTVGTTYYFWVRAKIPSSGAYTVLSSSSAAAVVAAPSGCTLSVNTITQLTCNAVVTMTTLGTSGYFNYFISSASTNSTSATMTDICGLFRSTTSQPRPLSGLSPSTTQYLFVRAQNAVTGVYTVVSTTGTTLTTTSGTAPSGGTCGTPSSVTSISATVAVTLTTLGTDSIYNYFLSASPTNSTGGTMTNLKALTAQTTSQNASLTLLAPSTTSYLFVRAQNIVTGTYTFMTTTGVTLTTLGTGSAPSGSTISVTSVASTTAVVNVTMTTLGTNANYVYYVSWCSSNSTGGTMVNVCLLTKQTASQTVYPSGLPAGTTAYLFIRAKNVLTGAYIVMSATGTAITLSASSLYYEAAALTAFDPVFNDSLGYSVAVSGSYMLVGAYMKDPVGVTDAGGVYVFELSGTTGEWEYKSLLYANDAYASDYFGLSVSVSGTYAVVGAYQSDPGGKTNAGAAYMFERDSGTGVWQQTTKLIASDAMPNDNFGYAVGVSGTYAVIGSKSRIQLGNNASGGAYVYERNSSSGVWEQKSLLFPSDLPLGSYFGSSVSVSGLYAIVGAYGTSVGGSVYVYERNAGTGAWEQKAILTCSDSTIGQFGYTVSIDGTYAMVGVYNKTVGSSSSAGGAYIFERVSGAWTQTAILNNPDPAAGDNFGYSVSVSGIHAVIGCQSKDPSGKVNAGSTYLYKCNATTGSWENKIEWVASDGLASDCMGWSVGISGTHVVSGAYAKLVTGQSYAGGAYVYELPSGTTVPPSGATLSAATATSGTTANVTLAMDTLGTDATYSYVISWTSTNVASATMTDCGTGVAQTASQTVALTGLTANTTYYLWARAKVTSSGAYTLLSATSVSIATPPIALSSITPLTCTATVTLPTIGTANAYNYFLSSSPTNSTSGVMTDVAGLLRQTSAQTISVSGLSPSTTQYLFVRWQAISDSSYTYVSSTGVTLTTTAGIAPSGGTCGTPSSVTSISATVAVTLTTLGTDSIYTYFVSSSPTNSTGGTMTNLVALTAQTASQNASLTLLAPSTTSYLFIRAQNVKTGSYIFMTTTGVTLTTLGTGSAPSGSTISVTSAASTTAVLAVTMTTLGTNANYVYYVSWCSTNSTGGTMANVCLIKAQTASQTAYPSGLPAGTTAYLFVRAKNVLTGAYTVMSATGTSITMSASSIYYEAAALTAFDPITNDQFGISMALSGSYAMIGAYTKQVFGLIGAGEVYFMQLNGSTGEWEHISVLCPNDVYTGDSFGISVSISGTYAVIGAYGSDPGGRSNAGVAYVFEMNSGTNIWEQKTKLIASDAFPNNRFGYSVSVSDTYAIIGGLSRNQLGVANSGGAYIFERNTGSGVWEQKCILYPSDLPTGSYFGRSVSVSGTYAIVGAYNKSGGGGSYIYERNSGTGVWEEKAILSCSDSTSAAFGSSVSIDGTYAAVCACTKTVNSLASSGGAYVFERVLGSWTQTAIVNNPDPAASDFFGQAVCVSGVYMTIGCYGKNPSGKADAGSTYLYKRNSSTGVWENKIEWTASDGLAGDYMGMSVGISGTHVMSAGLNKAVTGIAGAGGAYVYELPSGDTVPPSGATLSAATATSSTTANVTLAIDTLGTDAPYSYVISWTTTNSSAATMTDCGVALTQTASQTIALTGFAVNTTYYLWVRAKIPISGVYTLISASSVSLTTLPIALSAITPLTCTVTVTMPTVGTANAYNYFLSSSPTNSTSGTMTDLAGLLRQTTVQTVSVSGLSPNTTQYLFVRWQSISGLSYTYPSSTGVALTTSTAVAPSGGTCGTPSSVTSISATVAVTLTTLGTDSIYNYFVSSSPTNSTGGTMTNLVALTAQTASQNASLTLLAPSTTSYLFVRAQNVKTGSYIFMTTTGVTLTTLSTGSAPSGSTISVTSAASTTAVLAVTMTTLGTNANYTYYVSWCATNSTGGTMANVCLLKSQTTSQTVYPSGLPAGTSPYLFVRAKNVLTGAYTVMSATGTTITMSASAINYEAAALTAFDPVANDFLGISAAVSGTYAIVGTHAKDILTMSNTGAAYVFELNGNTGEWEHKSILYPSDISPSSYFGIAVSVSATYAVIGAYGSDSGGRSSTGAAYVFERNSSTNAWEQSTKLIASDAMTGDTFGYSVSVSGTYAVVGAYQKMQLGVTGYSGAAYVFERNTGSGVWEQKSVLFPSDRPGGANFGYSVSISGAYAIVGAHIIHRAYMFERNSGNGAWEEKVILSGSAGLQFGCSVSIDGTYTVIGSNFKSVGVYSNAGGAYVFERISGTWTQTASLDNPDPATGDNFGFSVSMSGIYAVIGCYSKSPSGSTYLYKRNSSTGTWENKIEWTAADGGTGDQMGRAVSISGTHVISGACWKTVTGVSIAGGAYVYELPSGTTVPPSGATLSAMATSSTTANATLTISTLGTDATYSYVVSWTSTNSSAATMTDCGTAVAQSASQTVALTGFAINTTYYLWVRAKIPSTGIYTLISASSTSLTTLPIALSAITPLTCTATVTMPAVGTANAYNYFLSSSPTNATSGVMTDLAGLLRQTTSQAISVSGLSPNTTQYLFVRWQAVSDSSYTYASSAGAVLTTTSGVAPSGGTCGTPSSVTSVSATVAVTMTTLGTDSIYNYFVSSSPTNSTGGTMANLVSLTAQKASQNASLTLLAPSTTSYLFVRAQNVISGSYVFMTTTGITLTTLGTGSAPSGSTISVTSAASTTAVLAVTMTTLGTNANYVYYVSWCSTNSVGGTMANVCLLAKQTASQTVYPSGLPAGTTAYLFIRAKNVISGNYTVMSASGTAITLSASAIYYETAAMTAFDPFANDYFGMATAVSGSYAVIAACYKDPLGYTNAGGVYVLELNGTTGEWEHKSVLSSSDACASDSFGFSVSVSGEYAVVGAFGSDPGGKTDAGAAYVFERNSGTGAWEQKTKLAASDALPSDEFGYSVSVSGTYVIIGVYSRTQLGVASSGGAYVFERNSGSGVWEQKAILFPSDLITASNFGRAVSISGTYAIVGALNRTGGGGAYVFERNSGTGAWEQTAILTCSDTTTALFGASVAIDGTYAVIGAQNKTVNSLASAGGAYVFERISGTWTQTAILDNPDPVASDYFGYTVSVSGIYSVLGCFKKDPSGKTDAGATYLYKRNATSGAWENKMEWTASDGLTTNYMGCSVSISGTHVVSGAYNKAVTGIAGAGGAYVYELPSGTVVAPSAGTISVANNSNAATVTIGVLGTDATYSYVVSRSTTSSLAATMTDCGTCLAQTAAQTVSLTGLTAGTYYFWLRAKVASSGVYTVLAYSSAVTTVTAPSGCTLSVNTITPLTCNAAVTLTTLGTSGYFNYFLSSASTNSTAATMTDVCGLLAQTSSQTPALSGFSPSTTQYLFVRAQNAVSLVYTVLSATGTTLTTTSAIAPSGGSCGTPSSVTSISATVAVTLTTLGTDSIYMYFVSSSPTNSTGGTMTNLVVLTAQTASQNAQLTLLAPSTTSYLFVRAQNVKTGTYTFMTTTGVTLTTLGTGSAPSGSTISVTSAASTTAVLAVTMTTLGTNANYVYYVSWCATNSTGGTMANLCLLAKQTSTQTVYPSGLPAGTSPYLFVRAKNVISGNYTVMSATGTAITLSASSVYYEAAALTAFDSAANDYFGYNIAVSGGYAVLGAMNKRPVGLNTGAAYVLELNGITGEWEHKSVIYPSDGFYSDTFGSTVSVSGTYAIVGAYFSDPGGKKDAGAAYVFERNSGTSSWEQKAKLVASDAMPGDSFGSCVGVSGVYVIVGASTRTRLGVANSGGAYIFERNSGSGLWEQKSILFPSDSPTGSYFGDQTSISGSYAIVGSINKTGGGGAYIYERNSGTSVWEEKAILTCSDSTSASFGGKVGIDGTYAAVTARSKTVNSITAAGAIYMFERISGTWTQTAVLDNPDPVATDTFGSSVSLSGSYTVIGCLLKDPASKTDAGSAYLYKRNSTTGAWENKIEWTASDGLAGDNMGYSAGISGTHVFVGAWQKSVTGASASGGAYVYELPSTAVVAPSATISVANGTYTASATVTIGTLGTDATYTYVVSRSTTNSSSATMTDCGTCVAQTSAQSVTLTGLTTGTTYYFWVRSKVASSSAYTVISSSSAAAVVSAPSGCTLSVNTITPLTCNAAVTMTTLGSAGFFNYFLSSASANSTGAAMTDICGLLAQTASQTPALSGLSPSTTQYLFVRAQHAVTLAYTVLSATGTTLTTTAGVAPSGGTCGTPSSVTSISATVAVTMTTLGTNSIYNYFVSSSPTNSTGGTMTNLVALTAQTASQNASLTLLAPSTTSYLFVRAQDIKTGSYTFMTTTGVTLTTLGTGNAPSGSTISVTSAASTTAVVAVTMTTLGTNANYVYYVSWCATNSTGGTMANVCLLAKQTASQTVYPSGLPGGTSPYLFVRAKNVLTGSYTVMSASGTSITMSASSPYYEAAALTAFDPVAGDNFGFSVAVSGSYAAVSANQKDPNGISNAGGVYMLELNTGTNEWEHTYVLYPSDVYSSDNFGAFVSLSGTYVVIGASQADPGGKANAGAAYVFERNSATNIWEQKTKLIASDSKAGDQFGSSVSVSGSYAVVGAYSKTQVGTATSGGVYFFERNSGSGVWEQKSALFPSDRPAGSNFGASVSISGTYAIAGAWFKNGNQTGGAYIFERNQGTGIWEEKAILSCSDSTNTQYGISVCVDGTYAIVGANDKMVNSLSGAGGAYIFERISGTWTQTAILDNPDPALNDLFGSSVGVSGLYVVIGSYWKDPTAKSNAGSVYLYKHNSTTGVWENKIEWTASDGLASDFMGFSVGISGNHVISGAYRKNVTGVGTSAGGAYVYELPSSSTSPVASISNASPVTNTATVTISTLGTDATYTYVASWASTNSSSATMTDFATLTSQTASQTISLSGISLGVYIFVRAKIVSTGAYSVISSGLLLAITYMPSGGSVSVMSLSLTTASVSVAITTLGTDDTYTYVVSRSATNSTGAAMTDCGTCIAQTASQTVSITGLTASTQYYLWVRAKNTSNAYTLLMNSGTSALTLTPLAYTGGAVTNVPIYGQSTGAIAAVSVSGGLGSYTYSWSSGISNPTANATKSSLPAGTYTLVITDTSGLTLSIDFIITQNPVLAFAGGAVTNASAYNQSNGAVAAITVSGGNGSYSFSWGNGMPRPTVNEAKTGIPAGSYTLTVTDGVGATKAQTFIISSPLTYSGGAIGDSAGSDGTISIVTVLGGVSPYSYAWTSNATTIVTPTTVSAKSSLAPGAYTLTVTDAQNVSRAFTFDVPVAPLTLTAGAVTDNTVYAGSAGAIGVSTARGGTVPYTYQWTSSRAVTMPLQNNANTGLRAGSYTLTVTDHVNATASHTFVISEPHASMTLFATPVSLRAEWDVNPDADGYRVEYKFGDEYILYSRYTKAVGVLIPSLTPNTSYAVRVSSVSAGVLAVHVVGVMLLPGQSTSNFSKAAFLVPGVAGSVYSATAVQAASSDSAVSNTIFTTGDVLQTFVKSDAIGTQKVQAKIVKLNESIPIAKNAAVYVPFDATTQGTQEVSLITSTGSTVPVSYANDSITIDGVTRFVGDSFILDGQKVKVCKV